MTTTTTTATNNNKTNNSDKTTDQQNNLKNSSDQNNKDISGQELDDLVERALACPCIDDLKSGPCGQPFISAFTCFLEKKQCLEIGGDECMPHFYKLQDCLVSNPQVFKEFMGNEHLFNKES